MILVDLRLLLSSCPRLSRRSCFQYSVVESDVETSPELQRGGNSVSGRIGTLVAAFRTFSGTRVFPKIQLRWRQQGNGIRESVFATER